MEIMNPVNINGVNIYPFKSTEELLDFTDGQKIILVAMNAGKVDRSSKVVKDIVNRNIGYCDGIWALLAVRKKGYKDAVKILGCELWLDIIERYYEKKSFYLIGAKQNVIEQVIAKLNLEFPGINIAGYRNGFITTTEDENHLVADIVNKQPDVVFVAMGSPKQELLMSKLFSNHNALYQGLGGSFDVYSGVVKDMPEWTIKYHVNGIYRVVNRFWKKNILKRFFLDLWYMIKLEIGLIK